MAPTSKRKHRIINYHKRSLRTELKASIARNDILDANNDGRNTLSTFKNNKSNLVILVNTIIPLILSTFLVHIQPSLQQSLCPKACVCDQNLEVRCNGDLGGTWMPHTFNPSIKRILINYAETNSISGEDLNYYSNLETLNIAFNKINVIDIDSIKSNVNLVLLNASHNSITEIKDATVTSVLNKIGYITDEDSLKGLKKARINVVELVLSYNQLKRLRDYTFMRLHKLHKLDLSYNQIVIIDTEALFGLNKLQMINLRGNHLLQMPSLALKNAVKTLSLQTVPSLLRTMDLGENSFDTIESNSLDTLERLQELQLDSCAIRSIQDNAFIGLKNLIHLGLQNNDIKEIHQEAFAGLDNLKTLNLDGNKFSYLTKGSFKHLSNLEELRLSNGSLSELDSGDFTGLNSLKKLSLDGNINLTKIPSGTLTSMPKLAYVSLYMNSITSLADDLTHHPLIILDLRDNQLDCDCDLKWLTKWLINFNETYNNRANNKSNMQSTQSHQIQISHDISTMLVDSQLTSELLNLTCSKPPALVGARIIDLPLNGLECLHPNSDMNVHIGFACLFVMITILTTICTVNLCRGDKRLLGLFKENLAPNRISMMLYNAQDNSMRHQNNHANETTREETQLGSALYEPVDYSQDNNGPVYTIPDESPNYLSQQSHRL